MPKRTQPPERPCKDDDEALPAKPRPKRKTGKGQARRRPKTFEEACLQNPKYALFAVELLLNDGEVGKAAEAVGYAAATGATIMRRYPELRERVRQLHETTAKSVRQQWAEIHELAVSEVRCALTYNIEAVVEQGEKLELRDALYLERLRLDASKARLAAAQFAVERVEGRSRQAVDLSLIEREEDELESVRYRFALSLARQQGWTLEKSLQYADENSELVQEWFEGLGPAADA